MGIVPALGSSDAVLTDKMLGNAYQVVRYVATQIEYIKHVSAHMAEVYRVAQSAPAIDSVITNIAVIEDLFDNIAAVIAVQGSVGNINAVGNAIVGVNAVSAALAQIIAVYDKLAEITSLAGAIPNKLDLAGGTMTGSLVLAGAPTLGLHAVTKTYVDDLINAIDTIVDELVAAMPAATVKGSVAGGPPVNLTGVQLRDSVIPAGFTIDRARATYATYGTFTDAIPTDDTIPQIGEGTEILTLSITPKSVTNRLRVQAKLKQISANGVVAAIAALFHNSNANAVDATSITISASGYNSAMPMLEYEFVPGATTLQTFSVRVGTSSGGTIYMHGNALNRLYGGIQASSLTIEEIKA